MPVLHAAAALQRLAECEYSPANSIFIRKPVRARCHNNITSFTIIAQPMRAKKLEELGDVE